MVLGFFGVLEPFPEPWSLLGVVSVIGTHIEALGLTSQVDSTRVREPGVFDTVLFIHTKVVGLSIVKQHTPIF